MISHPQRLPDYSQAIYLIPQNSGSEERKRRERGREGGILTNSKFTNLLELNKRRFDLQPVKDHDLYLETRTVCEIKWIYEDFGERNR